MIPQSFRSDKKPEGEMALQTGPNLYLRNIQSGLANRLTLLKGFFAALSAARRSSK